MKPRLKIGVIGYGYWGPNLVRNFNATNGVRVIAICDNNSAALNQAKAVYPHLKYFSNHRDLTASKEIDAIVIATPVSTHFELAKKSLKNNKHIFVEKPFTSTIAEAKELIEIAEKKKLKIMVDHTYLFTGAVRKIKELIDGNVLGELCYYDSTRINLGLFQKDVNVISDLAPHDLSIMDYLIKERPVAILATGAKHLVKYQDYLSYITIYFKGNLIAHFNVNWLSPVKVRMTFIGGKKKMLVWNDLHADEKIKVYDKSVNIKTRRGLYRLLVEYRSGDIWIPKVDHKEALAVESEYFIDCILNNKIPVNDGHAGLRIVKMLEASERSLRNRGRLIKL